MSKVVLKIKALPKEVTPDMNPLMREISSFLSEYGLVYRIGAQPLAFGLSVVEITLITEETNGTSQLEEAFKSFKGADLSIIDVSRMPEV